MREGFVDKASGFYMDLFTLEWRKMVLPVLMVLLLSASAFSTLDLRGSPEMDQRMDVSIQASANLTVLFLRMDYFNESVNESERTLSSQIGERANRLTAEATPKHYNWKLRTAGLQNTGFFPYTPEFDTPLPISRQRLATALALMQYRQERFGELGERLNSSENVTLQQFEEEVQRIRSVDWDSEEVKSFVRNSTEQSSESGGARPGLSPELKESLIEEEFREVGLLSYIPALIATFMLYYVINAVMVESGRKVAARVREMEFEEEESEEKEDDEESSETGDEDDEDDEEASDSSDEEKEN